MPASRREPLLRVSCFEVVIGDREIGFAQVGRLTSESAPDRAIDARAHRFATVVLRRALSTSTELFDWRSAVAAGKDDRRDVLIRQLSAPGGSVVNAWRLVGAQPCRWSGPAFDALHDDIAVEEIELALDDVVWFYHERPTPGG